MMENRPTTTCGVSFAEPGDGRRQGRRRDADLVGPSTPAPAFRPPKPQPPPRGCTPTPTAREPDARFRVHRTRWVCVFAAKGVGHELADVTEQIGHGSTGRQRRSTTWAVSSTISGRASSGTIRSEPRYQRRNPDTNDGPVVLFDVLRYYDERAGQRRHTVRPGNDADHGIPGRQLHTATGISATPGAHAAQPHVPPATSIRPLRLPDPRHQRRRQLPVVASQTIYDILTREA